MIESMDELNIDWLIIIVLKEFLINGVKSCICYLMNAFMVNEILGVWWTRHVYLIVLVLVEHWITNLLMMKVLLIKCKC